MAGASVDIDHAVAKMAETVLRQDGWEFGQLHDCRALFVEIDLRVGRSGSEEPNAMRFVNLIFQRYGNGFHVWSKVTKEAAIWRVSEDDFNTWRNTSNHDSCWRDDGLTDITKTYFALCKEYDPTVAPIKLEQFAWLRTEIMHIESEFDKETRRWRIKELEKKAS